MTFAIWYLAIGIPLLAVAASWAALTLTRRRHRQLASIISHERDVMARRAQVI